MVKIRKEVMDFAEDMEKVLRKNDHKSPYLDESDLYMIHKLLEEVAEICCYFENHHMVLSLLRQELNSKRHPNKDEIKKEAVDVANIAMMIYDRENKRK